jgi:molybdopterin synthase catalytic subunit
MKISEQYLIDGPVEAQLIAKQIEKTNSKTDIGGHAFFLGQVRRDKIKDKFVSKIIYSAYEQMVSKELDKIKENIYAKYDDVKSIEIIHSIGGVNAGEISMFVMTSAGHRIQAFDSCREIVDLIKAHAPIWKKEVLEDDSYKWTGSEL